MVADPYHILDCSTTTEGGCALVLTTEERARDLRKPPVAVLGGGTEYFGPAYRLPAEVGSGRPLERAHQRPDRKAQC